MEYDTVLINEFEKYRLEIIQTFQTCYDEERTFKYSIDKIRNNIVSKKCNNILYKYENLFNNSIYNFNHFDDYYKKGTSISVIIENEVLAEFNIAIDRYQINTDTNHELHNYTFEEFINDLIVYDTLGRIVLRLDNNYELYELFFELNNYEEFTLENFQGDVIESKIYKKYHKILYPENNISQEIELTSEAPILSKMTISDKLNNEEKAFLFYIKCKAMSEPKKDLKSVSFNLPATELLRLKTITDFKDFASFDENKYRDSTNYKILTQGIKFFATDDRIDFIKTLIEKLKDFKLPKTTKYIKEILNKEHNKNIK